MRYVEIQTVCKYVLVMPTNQLSRLRQHFRVVTHTHTLHPLPHTRWQEDGKELLSAQMTHANGCEMRVASCELRVARGEKWTQRDREIRRVLLLHFGSKRECGKSGKN